MSKITWLHLSDLHFRESANWDENIVLKALLTDIREQIKSEHLRPDFIVVTGDIAFRSAPEEYTLAGQFFDKLLKATDLRKEHIFIVPGNHDVDRSTITEGTKAIISSLKSRKTVAEVLTADADRQLIMRKFNHYFNFANDYFKYPIDFDDGHYFYTERIDIAGKRVAIIGFNSAWMSLNDQDYGSLLLSERQVRPALEVAKNADLRIALLHHPFEWFQEFDKNDWESMLMQDCDFVLHGQLHRTDLLNLNTPDATAMIIGAGACYETRKHPNAFNFVRFDYEAGKGTVFLRTYSDKQGGFWTEDVQTYKNAKEGRFEFKLEVSRKKTLRKGKRKVPDKKMVAADRVLLEEAYINRVFVTSKALPLFLIDPRAVERTRQQTMDLVAVYIAGDTLTLVARDESEDKEKNHLDEEMGKKEEEPRVITALKGITMERQMVLLGNPGSGKSTFTNHLALCLAGERIEKDGKWLFRLEPVWTHGPLLPLRLTLREFAASDHCSGTAAGLWDFITDTFISEGLGDYAPIMRECLLKGGVMALFDGLDEVADPDERIAVRNAVAEFAVTYGHPKNRYLVTCRSYAYQDMQCQLSEYVTHTLAPFNQGQINKFIRYWYKEVCRLGWKSPAEAEDMKNRLQNATRRADLMPLARNPLQLTMMASLHFSWGRLPEDRVELYQEMVRLLLVRWQEARLGEDVGVTKMVSAGKLESVLERVAFVAHRAQEGSEGPANISEAQLRSVLKDCVKGSWDRAGELMKFIKERAGLLIEQSPGVYTFPHRSYQEYLAGAYLSVQSDFPNEMAHLVRANYTQWREVTLWAVGVMARLKKMTYIAIDVASALCPHEIPDGNVPDKDWIVASLASEVLLEVGLEEIKSSEMHEYVIERILGWLKTLVERGVLTPAVRSKSGDTMARLGDTRTEVTTLKDIQFCCVPHGSFWMGSDEYAWEKPQQINEKIDYDFWISRFPITNAQFALFVESGGYEEFEYWPEAKKARVWEDGKVKGRWDEHPRNEPHNCANPYDLPNHPVVGITWYEALAFTRWLRDYLIRKDLLSKDWTVSLPYEAEWEKAARGGLKIPKGTLILPVHGITPDRYTTLIDNPDPNRRYPWGKDIDVNLVNYYETGIGYTSTVGCFPGGVSPYGCEEMSGNVWEWTGSIFKGYPYDPKDGREDLSSQKKDNPRVIRGGSYDHDGEFMCCSSRRGDHPYYWFNYVGFRVLLSPHL